MTITPANASTARDELRSFVERAERLDEEIKGLNGDKRDLYAEAKGRGFDVKALKAVIAYRRKDPQEAQELSAIFDTYLHILEGGSDGAHITTHARTRTRDAA